MKRETKQRLCGLFGHRAIVPLTLSSLFIALCRYRDEQGYAYRCFRCICGGAIGKFGR
jgi:hypothetical protein